MISNKECFCYAIKVKDRDYLMFIDNKVNLDLIKSNYNIIVMEDNLPQEIKLIYLDNGFIQRTIDNITVSFVRYYGKLNPKNIIKYNDNYFSTVFNSVLKDYENHLNELTKDINNTSNSHNCEHYMNRFFLFIGVMVFIILLVLICSGVGGNNPDNDDYDYDYDDYTMIIMMMKINFF